MLATVADASDDFTIARELLVRERERGTSFEVAWGKVFEQLPSPGAHPRAEGREREATRTALKVTEEDWRLSYERKPPRERPGSERAIRRRLAKLHAVAA